MDAYIQKHFAGALAYKELIRCLKWYMDQSSELIRQDPIQETMRALEYIFKFIVRSRLLYSRATGGQEDDDFHVSVHQLFTSLRVVLNLDAQHADTLLFSQAALLSSFPAIFEELLQVFSLQEVCEEARGLLGCMSSSLHAGPSTDAERLQSVARTVDSPLFSFS
ncbi:hypothetical protein CRUP_038092, partial [Coryphaenoides rupestris]